MDNKLRQEQAHINRQIEALQKRYDHIDEVIEGDKPDDAQAARIKSQRYSYGVHFVRRKALRRVRSPSAVCKSLRRFTTPKEAAQHGKRFTRINRHKGFKVVKVSMRANAWINWVTGKTNPVI